MTRINTKLIEDTTRAGMFLEYISDAAFAADITPVDGYHYYNTVTHDPRIHRNGQWGSMLNGISYSFIQEKLTIVTQNIIPALSNTPVSNSSVLLFLNGKSQEYNNDFTVSGQTITWYPVPSGIDLLVGEFVTVLYPVQNIDGLLTNAEVKYIFRADGEFAVADFIDSQIVTSVANINAVKVYRRKSGTSGTTVLDIKKEGISILPSTISLDASSGDGYKTTINLPSPIVLAVNDILHMEIVSVEAGSSKADIHVVIF